MQFYSFAFLAMTLAGMAAAKPAIAMVVKESVSAPPQWVRTGPAPDSHVINMQFGLKQQAMGSLVSKLDDISHPDSPNYGKWLSHEEVHAYTTPSQDSIQAVKSWLEAHGIKEKVEKRSISGDWMTAEVTVAQARELLGDADFAVWQHRSTGEQLVRTTEYSVPRSVADHIDLIGPTTYFSQIRALNKQGKQSSKLDFKPLTQEHMDFVKSSTSQDVVKPLEKGIPASSVTPASTDANYPTVNGVPTSCNIAVVTYDCLRQFYKTFNYKVAHPKQQRIGVSGFLNQYASYADLKKFFQTQRPPAYQSGYNFTTVLVNPSAMNNQAMPGDEANLDVQAVGAVAYNIPYTFYSNGGSPPFTPDEATPTNTNEPYSTEFTYLLALPDKQLPSILTTSYGDDEQTVPLSYATRVCNEIATLGARGMTIFFSSGDSGVGVDGDCVSNDGKNTPRFLPAFPATCPYVTSVGATEQ
jgi:tripeptidyl-peptidase-1